MKPTLHQLQVLEKIYESGGVTHAAKAMHMTQPAISNILKQLEIITGKPLTEVISRKTYLTPAGKIMLAAGRDIHNRLDQALADISSLDGKVAGQLSVACVSTAKYFIPHLLSAFKAHYPKVDIQLKIKNREEIVKRLYDNQDDFVIMSQPPTDQAIDKLDFYEDRLVIVAPKTHPLHRKKGLQLKDLKDEPWLIREEGSGTRIAMTKLLKQHKTNVRSFIEIDNNESIKQAIIAGLGISMISNNSIELELATNLLQILHVEGFPVPYRWYLVKQRKKELSLVAQKFHEFVATHPSLGHLSQKAGII